MIPESKLLKGIRRYVPFDLKESLCLEDDAGLLGKYRQKDLLVTSDVIVEGVDFLRDALPEQIGHKALAVNLSDVAAMAARPLGFMVILGIPSTYRPLWIQRFYRGLLKLARRYEVTCLGGDISRARQLFAAVTVVADTPHGKYVTRRGARPGDCIAVTGQLGGSILKHHLTFEPRLREALFLKTRFDLTSLIDISDGLLRDLGHLLRLSGAGACLELSHIPISEDARRLAGGNERKALEHALMDGEDFELLFTLPEREKTRLTKLWRQRFPRLPLSWIGVVSKQRGRISWRKEGQPVSSPSLKRAGYEHFL